MPVQVPDARGAAVARIGAASLVKALAAGLVLLALLAFSSAQQAMSGGLDRVQSGLVAHTAISRSGDMRLSDKMSPTSPFSDETAGGGSSPAGYRCGDSDARCEGLGGSNCLSLIAAVVPPQIAPLFPPPPSHRARMAYPLSRDGSGGEPCERPPRFA